MTETSESQEELPTESTEMEVTEEVPTESTDEESSEEASTESTDEESSEEAPTESTEEEVSEEASTESTEEESSEDTQPESTEEEAPEETQPESTEENAQEEFLESADLMQQNGVEELLENDVDKEREFALQDGSTDLTSGKFGAVLAYVTFPEEVENSNEEDYVKILNPRFIGAGGSANTYFKNLRMIAED